METIFSSDKASCRTKVSIVKRKNFAALRVVLGRACGRRRQFTFHQMAEISQSKTSSMEGLARVYDCSARTIARIRDVCAFGLVSMQELMLGWLLMRLKEFPPDWGLRSRLWDETGQRLVLRVNTGVASHGQTANWQVLVARFRFVWGWHTRQASSSDAHAFLSWEPVVPAVPLLSNSAANIAAGLEAHSVTAPLHQFSLHLQRLCGVWFDLAESDGATANERFVAARYQDDATGHLICCNHGNHLGEVAVVTVAGQRSAGVDGRSILNDVYASALFLRMHGHMLRLMVSLRGALKKMLLIRHGPPPECAQEYNACIRSMLHAEHDFTSGASSKKRLDALLDRFFSCFNGRHWVQGVVEVYDNNAQLDSEQWLSSATDAALGVLLSRLPPVPSSGKWEKLTPCIFFIVKLQMHGLLAHMLEPAFQNAGFHSSAGRGSTDDDPHLKMDMSWHEVAGKRFERFKAFLHDTWSQFVMRSLLLVLEVFRILTLSFMSASNRRACVGFSPLQNMLYEKTSVVVWSLQYLSSLLRLTPSRCRLLWQPHYDSCIEWVRQRPEEAAFFRRLVLHSIGQIELRHVRKLFILPWRLFTISDSRRPLMERKSLGLAFLDLPRCCVPWGFARGLHARRSDPSDPQISGMLGCVSSWICMSLHCIERLHAVNRRHVDPRKACGCVSQPRTIPVCTCSVRLRALCMKHVTTV